MITNLYLSQNEMRQNDVIFICTVYVLIIWVKDEYTLNHSLHVSKLTGWYYFPISNVLLYFGAMEKLKTHSWKPFV